MSQCPKEKKEEKKPAWQRTNVTSRSQTQRIFNEVRYVHNIVVMSLRVIMVL